MEKTYRPVLSQLITEEESEMRQNVDEFQKIIGALIILATPLSVKALGQLLEIPEQDISTRLDLFHSVLSIPDDADLPVRALHLSFHDYLVHDQTRAHKATSPFWVDEREKNSIIAGHCLHLMHRSLKKNICKLPSYGTSRDTIDPASITGFLPDALQYACRYWAYHVTRGTGLAQSLAEVLEKVLAFLEEHLLHWLECTSLMGTIYESINSINAILELVDDTPNIALSLFLLDVKRFILKNAHIADRAPLQLYCSALIFAPRRSLVKGIFENDIPKWMLRLPDVEQDWSPELQTLEHHSRGINRVVFSPNGNMIASASDDWTINVWSTTGALEGTLEDHQDSVVDIAFSPDGKTLASASLDGTIILWDSTWATRKKLDVRDEEIQDITFYHDGRVVDPSDYLRKLEGPGLCSLFPKDGLSQDDRWVNTLAISYSGELLASGCSDGTIQLWNLYGKLQHSLKAHEESVDAIAVSPDGNFVASGSADGSVALWNTTGALRHTFIDSPGGVKSVMFSPDGGFIVTITGYGELRVWDQLGTLQHTIGGPSQGISCIAFSPNAAVAATGSNDGVSLWHTDNWNLNSILPDDTGVLSLAFSPDGKQLVTGTYHNTLSIWQVDTGVRQSALNGHSGVVDCVAFSPTGKLIVSGSRDGTVRIWDPTVVNLEYSQNDTDLVSKVVVSPNGKQVAAMSSTHSSIQLSGVDDGRLDKVLLHNETGIKAFLYTPDSRFLLFIGAFCQRPMIWNTTTGALIHSSVLLDSSELQGAQISPDSKTIAYRSHGAFDFREMASQNLLHSVKTESNMYYRAEMIFSPCSTLVAIYSKFPYHYIKGEHEDEDGASEALVKWPGDRGITILNATSGSVQSVISGHLDLARTVRFSPDTHYLASTSADKTIKLWNTATGDLEHSFQDTVRVTAVAFSPDTETLGSTSNDDTIKVWDINSGTIRSILLGAEEVYELSFSLDGKYLKTDRGSINIEESEAKGVCVFQRDDVSVDDGEWVHLRGEKIIWLPHDYRNTIAVRGTRVIMAHSAGGLRFMDVAIPTAGL
ncbi:WD40-repeat-containing domain protein [Aspergillus californicus]